MPGVWPYWVDQGTTGGTYNQPTWQAWVQTTGTTATIYPNPWYAWQTTTPQILTASSATTVWVNWQASDAINRGVPGYAPQELSAEEKAEQARRTLISRQRSHASRLRRNIAGRRAELLLLEHLNDQQREQWADERAFTVETADGKRAYRIEYGLAGNVRLVKADEAPVSKHGNPLRVGARFCAHVCHPDGLVPNQDNVLAQKLLLEANERHFLDLANVS